MIKLGNQKAVIVYKIHETGLTEYQIDCIAEYCDDLTFHGDGNMLVPHHRVFSAVSSLLDENVESPEDMIAFRDFADVISDFDLFRNVYFGF